MVNTVIILVCAVFWLMFAAYTFARTLAPETIGSLSAGVNPS
jgi:hypothetical protein